MPRREPGPDSGPIPGWPPLSRPYRAPNGLVVEVASSTRDLVRYGRALDNILESAVVAAAYASRILRGRQHIYAVLEGDAILSNGELVVADDEIEFDWNRGLRNGKPDPRSKEAIRAYVEAIRRGEVDLAYRVRSGGFEPLAPEGPGDVP